MCSIMALAKKHISMEEFQMHFATTSRGPDMSRVEIVGDSVLGFQRLAIMGLNESGMQPFSLHGNYVVCNGELYGFRQEKEILENEGYTFLSDSDCEIILPMYEKYGVEMFERLDAEFAMIIYDAKKDDLIAEEIPIGIRPLFYAYDSEGSIMFASEAKNLIGLSDKVMPFPPGHQITEDGKFICYKDLSKRQTYSSDDLETACKKIKELLVKGVEKRLDADAPVGFLLSGGLDLDLWSVPFHRRSWKADQDFCDRDERGLIDLKYAKEVADYLHSDHHEIIINKDIVLSSLEEVVRILGTFDITTIRASMGMYLICKAIHEETDVRVLLTGEISDEIFGYKYTDFAPDAESFQEEAEKRLRELYMYDVLRADRCISVNSMEARVPFGDLDFVRYVMASSKKLKMNTYNKRTFSDMRLRMTITSLTISSFERRQHFLMR